MKKNLPKRVVLVQLVVDQFVSPDPAVPNTAWDASSWFLGPKHLPRVSLERQGRNGPSSWIKWYSCKVFAKSKLMFQRTHAGWHVICLEVATCQIDRLLHDGLAHLWHPAMVSKAIVCTHWATGIHTEWWNCSCKMSNPQKLEVDAMLKPWRSLLPTTQSNPVLFKLLLDSWK